MFFDMESSWNNLIKSTVSNKIIFLTGVIQAFPWVVFNKVMS